jgi:hypothetical protein
MNTGRQLSAEASMHGQLTMTASLALRMNYSVPHLLSAAMFSRRVGQIEMENAGKSFGPFWDDLLANATACIFLSVAGLEAYVNELFSDKHVTFPSVEKKLLETVWAAFEQKTILERFDLVLILRAKPTLEKGAEPYQSVQALIRLRNALMHFKPEWDHQQIEHKKLSNHLRTYFGPNEHMRSDLGVFPRAWVSHGCTTWALNSVYDFLEHFEARGELPHRLANFTDRLKP